jgi:hypothetical protein
MVKIFKFEEIRASDDMFSKLANLGSKRKEQITKFFNELVDTNMNIEDPIADDSKSQFVFHSMILNLDDVNTIYQFYKDHIDDFTTSKQAVKNLC